MRGAGMGGANSASTEGWEKKIVNIETRSQTEEQRIR